ncbi:MAG TPA: hypothetical protein VEI97_01910, partial [bacterium]|nr:hypothetical protein [bacterium]
MGTEVRYGEIRLSFVKTEALDAVPAMDPSGTDQLYTKFTYQCSGIFTKESDPALANETPAETYQRVRHMLTRPRQ